jgi:predicted porin
MVGVAGFYQSYNDALSALNAGDSNVGGATADITWNFGGASIFASFVWENSSRPGAGGGNANPWGFNVQAGYFLNDDIEVFGRYDYANGFDYGGNGYEGESTNLSVITVGVNYFLSDNVRLTADFGWSFNDIGALFGNATSTGFAPAENIGNQYAIRTQLQLTF